MRLQTITDPSTGAFLGLEFRSDALELLELCGKNRLRIAADGRPLLWAKLGPYWHPTPTLRSLLPHSPRVLAPLRAEQARRLRSPQQWCTEIAKLLGASSKPQRRWRLMPTQRERFGRRAIHPMGTPPGLDDISELNTSPVQDIDHISSFRGLLPLRAFSGAEAGRVKAWQKHARSGSLPPLLLWWVTALNEYVLLDGHDRLEAALLEGKQPSLLALWEPRQSTIDSAPWREGAVARYERAFEHEAKLQLRTRQEQNRLLTGAFCPYEYSTSTARYRPRLRAEWDAQVRALVDALPSAEQGERLLEE